jgi:hypothetical protein
MGRRANNGGSAVMEDGLKTRAILWLAGKLPPCEEITRMASESLERPLTLKELIQKRLHFLICVWCARYWSQITTMRETVRAHTHDIETSEDRAGATLSVDAKERLKRALRERGSK